MFNLTQVYCIFIYRIYIYICISYMYLEPNWPLFLKVNPPKQGPNFNQNKGHLGSRYIHICHLHHFTTTKTSEEKHGSNGWWILEPWNSVRFFGGFESFTTHFFFLRFCWSRKLQISSLSIFLWRLEPWLTKRRVDPRESKPRKFFFSFVLFLLATDKHENKTVKQLPGVYQNLF